MSGREDCTPNTRQNQECVQEARVLAEMINLHAAERGLNLSQVSQADDLSQISSPSSECSESSDDFAEKTIPENVRNTPLHVMQTIVRLSATRSEKGIQGSYKWYRRQYLSGFKTAVEHGGTRRHKLEDIETFTIMKFRQARDDKLPVRGWTIQDWALERAAEIDLDFKASKCWLDNFKKRNRIVGRKVTKISTRSEREKQLETENTIHLFHDDYRRISGAFPHSHTWNFDQTSFNYEMHNLRTLSHQGERDTELEADSINKQTHSYTSQVIMSRDGRTIGRVLLCMQEDVRRLPRDPPDDDPVHFFGPLISKDVIELENRFKNIRVYASKSGKMSSNLTKLLVKGVVSPAIRQHGRPVLILADSWSGQDNEWVPEYLRSSHNSKLLTIPPRTTGEI